MFNGNLNLRHGHIYQKLPKIREIRHAYTLHIWIQHYYYARRLNIFYLKIKNHRIKSADINCVYCDVLFTSSENTHDLCLFSVAKKIIIYTYTSNAFFKANLQIIIIFFNICSMIMCLRTHYNVIIFIVWNQWNWSESLVWLEKKNQEAKAQGCSIPITCLMWGNINLECYSFQ